MNFGEMGVLLLSDSSTSTQTAVSTQQVSWMARAMGGNHLEMIARGLGKLWKMIEVNLYDVEDGTKHADSPESRKSQMRVVVSEERMVLKNEIIFAHVCTWNEFI